MTANRTKVPTIRSSMIGSVSTGTFENTEIKSMKGGMSIYNNK